MLTNFHWDEAKKKIFFWKKIFKMTDSKKTDILAPPILNIFSKKIMDCSLG